MPAPRAGAPLVSVVLPVYNGENYLRNALDSILSQDHRPLEVIVVDDGSTDGSARIARESPEIRCISLSHGGPARALNVGVAAARGEFVTFLDSDDEWTSGAVRLRLAHLAIRPATGMVLAKLHNFLEEGASPPTSADRQAGDLILLQLGALMVRREALARVGPFNEGLLHAVDLDFLMRARDAGVGLDLLQEVVLRRRVHDGSLSCERTPHDRLRALQASAARKRGEGRLG